MSICNVLCSTALPTGFAAACLKKTRKAGIKAVGMMRCNVSIDLTDVIDVAAAVTAGTIVMFPVGLGSKPRATSTKKKLESCQVDMPMHNYTHTIAFKSAYIDAALADYAFYNSAILNAETYKFFWLDCNDQLFINPAWVTGSVIEHSGLDMVVEGGLVIAEDGINDTQMYELDFSFSSGFPIIAGKIVVGIASALGI